MATYVSAVIAALCVNCGGGECLHFGMYEMYDLVTDCDNRRKNCARFQCGKVTDEGEPPAAPHPYLPPTAHRIYSLHALQFHYIKLIVI